MMEHRDEAYRIMNNSSSEECDGDYTSNKTKISI